MYEVVLEHFNEFYKTLGIKIHLTTYGMVLRVELIESFGGKVVVKVAYMIVLCPFTWIDFQTLMEVYSRNL